MIHVLRPQAELLGREIALEEDGEEAALDRMGLLEGEALGQELARAERPVGHECHGSLVAPGGACWQGGAGTGWAPGAPGPPRVGAVRRSRRQTTASKLASGAWTQRPSTHVSRVQRS